MHMTTQRTDLPEKWHSVYWFPSNNFVGDEPSEYDMTSYWNGDTLILESEPNDENSYMLIRLRIKDDIAIGGWYETTSPSGEFKQAQYSGSGQLVVDPKTHFMEGKWAGAGYDHKLKRMRIYTGNWEITPISQAE
jgi:hypothetical protein